MQAGHVGVELKLGLEIKIINYAGENKLNPKKRERVLHQK